eukprot:127935_1
MSPIHLITHTLFKSCLIISHLDSVLLIASIGLYQVCSQAPTTPSPTEDPEQYTPIYYTIGIIFGILFCVVICCLGYRIYKKKQETQNQTTKKAKKSSTNKDKQSNGAVAPLESEEAPLEQVKFRGGSMSSVENRHERVPSKPVVIAITTPKGTRHVADAFGDYANAAKQKEDELPRVDENAEEDYDDGKGTNHTKNNTDGDGQ